MLKQDARYMMQDAGLRIMLFVSCIVYLASEAWLLGERLIE